MKFASSLLLGAAILSGCSSLSPRQSGEPMPIGVAILRPTAGNTAHGSVSFVPHGNRVRIDAYVSGLTPGKHGFHLHEKGDCSAPDAMSAGGHFNPHGKTHGAPDSATRHAGDFGNITADAAGNAELKLSIPVSELVLAPDAPNTIIGRALIVHADPDDLATDPAGNAGKRIACGVVRLR